MLYATSKDRFRRELQGIHYEIQATDPTEMDLEVIRDLHVSDAHDIDQSLNNLAPGKADQETLFISFYWESRPPYCHDASQMRNGCDV
ncbi:hypothetical protein RJ639_008176 [Escallonia herrerae]|uniref:ADF-H domain-containing protein n=1 Tax=Escallonia herrerae TaxID=1293975 RepID=A0AA88VSD0_9ASTE|nr:hypothetical protein RJ639_008176 [Escallonia herrerae]